MTVWKVGDRARIRKDAKNRYGEIPAWAHNKFPDPRGKTCTIVSIPAYRDDADCSVEVDDYPLEPHFGAWATRFDALEPLTDTKADEFVERMKKLAREPQVPVCTPQPEEHGNG